MGQAAVFLQHGFQALAGRAFHVQFQGTDAFFHLKDGPLDLQQGVVDGQCYGYIGFKANKFNEANQKYLTEVHYTYQLQPLVISERVFKKMTPEMQKLLIDAGKYAQEKVLKYQIEQADAAKKYLIDNGLQVSQLEDEDVWKKAAMEKVWTEMADFVGGKETINAYLKACGKPLWK